MKKVLDNHSNRSLLLNFRIVWHEGNGEHDGANFKSWNDAQRAMIDIFQSLDNFEGGYRKTKIHVLWDNGSNIEARIDIGGMPGDFCPVREKVGDYLKKLMLRRNYEFTESVNFSDVNSEQQQTIPIDLELSQFAVNASGNIIKL